MATPQPQPPQPDRADVVAAAIEACRTKLLDLTLGNRLLNFRHTDRSRTHVRIIDEIPELLFDKLEDDQQLTFRHVEEPGSVNSDEDNAAFQRALASAKDSDGEYVEQRKQLGSRARKSEVARLERDLRDRVRQKLGMPPRPTAQSISDRARELGLDPSYDLPRANGNPAKRHEDKYIQTLHYRETLESKLAGMRDADRTLLSDAGVNALYCAVGFVEWYEADHSDARLYAPLVFYPVELEKTLQRGQYKYTIKRRDDDIETNITFAEKVKRDFGLQLPMWAEESSLSSYFTSVQRLLHRAQPRWTLKRWLTVGLFTFAKLAMYKDLEEANWESAGGLANNKILRGLFTGEGVEQNASAVAPEHDIDALEVQERAPIIITEADSSQHSALVDALSGKNLVIQGPPGTGKSQTITNIIAAALHAGKSVLFVAEKMAALSVVKDRLDRFGIGDFCLEVHSNRTRKTAVRDALESRLSIDPPSSPEDDRSRRAWNDARSMLLHYVNATQEVFGDTGLTVYDVLRGNCSRCDFGKTLHPSVRKTKFRNPKTLDVPERQRCADLAAEIERIGADVAKVGGTLAAHPWRAVENSNLDGYGCEELSDAIEQWAAAISSLRSKCHDVAVELGWPFPSTLAGASHFVDCVALLPDRPDNFLPQVFQHLVEQSKRELLAQIVEWLETGSRRTKALAGLCESPADIVSLGHVRIDELTTDLRHLNIVGSDAEMLAIVERREDIASGLEAAADLGSNLSIIIGSGHGTSVAALRATAKLGATLTGISGELLRLRCDEVTRDEALPILQRGERQSVGIREMDTRCRTLFEFTLLPDSQDIKAAARELVSAGFWAKLFSGSYRRAKKLFRGISQPAKADAKPREAAHRLADLSAYLDQLARFNNDSELRGAAGRHFRGIDTPWESLLVVAKWASTLRQSLCTTDIDENRCREFGLSAPIDSLLAMRSHAVSDSFRRFADTISTISEGEDKNVGELAAAARSLAERSATARYGVLQLRMKPEADSRNLSLLSSTVQDVELMAERVQAADVKKAFPDVDTAADRFEGIRDTLMFADELAECAPQGPFLRLFARPVDEELQKWRGHADEISTLVTSVKRKQQEAERLGSLNRTKWSIDEWEDADLPALAEKLLRAYQNSSALQPYLEFVRVEQEGFASSLAPILESYVSNKQDYARLSEAFEFVFYRSTAAIALGEDEQLKSHAGASHEQLRKRFQKLDRQRIELNRKAVAYRCYSRPVDPGNNAARVSEKTGMALIRHQIGLQKRHAALRDLFRRAGHAIVGLKPCLMMSPMSVAQFLAPNSVRFDLIVMDEASQIRPEDALGAVARGRQVIVVGDPKQLPPTSFFDRLNVDDDATEDEDEDARQLAGQESILDVAAAAFAPMRSLLWHYRSQHESLIAFSNKEFYQNRLIVFPAPHGDDERYGVRCVKVDGQYRGRVNRKEAEAIISAAQEFMTTFPKRSLGIVAINQPQRDLISELMDELFASDPQAESYRQQWAEKLEHFFVKNLENVQGDERDVIFISTVYGPDEAGVFRQQFGPINSRHGHRRLNVLFTRAKQQVRVFTSMNPADITPAQDTRIGVIALKNYLQYAQDGMLTFAGPTGREPDSEFEVWVAEKLRENGYEVVPQLGVAGYFIDMAVRNPKRRGSFLAAVECDGATYHSAKSVRDRDRLRQQILEQLGWTIYRIWSTDWFRNPGAEVRRLLDFLSFQQAG